MADSFHFSVNIISRGKGKSAVASAAYISGEKIKNEWDGVTHDYTRKTMKDNHPATPSCSPDLGVVDEFGESGYQNKFLTRYTKEIYHL